MNIDIPKIQSKFYINNIYSDSNDLHINIGVEDSQCTKIVFEYVRSFIFFKESDLCSDLACAKLEPVISSEDGGVFRVLEKPILAPVFKSYLEDEEPNYYLVITPDECIEVISFSPPRIEM